MAAEKLIKFLSDVKLLWGAILLIIPVGIWAADTVFQTDNEALASEVRTLIRVQKDLQVQLGYAESERKKDELMSRIRLIQLEIDELRSEQ